MAARKQAVRDEILAKIDATWGEFLAALDAVPADARHIPGVCGYWAVPELIAHISYWEAKVPDYVARHQANIKQADWNEYKVIAKGNHLQHFINGKQTVDVTDETAEAAKHGVLALQIHAGAPFTVQFKDILLKELK